MTQTEGDNPPGNISIGRFVLDLSRGRLLNDGREIGLSPHALAVLRYLAERPGQRVPTEEILEAAWPGTIGSDDRLVQSIDELRRVFGDVDGRLIQYELAQGALLDPSGAPPERRQARGVQPLRFRWKYGLIAPFVVAIVFAGIWLGTSRSPRMPRPIVTPAVAVLPFQNQSDDPALGPQADLFTQNLIAALARQTTFAVRSWEDVSVYKGVLAQPGEIARVLAVHYQVEGSVRHADEQIRVSAQLVDLQGQVLWSARYVEPAGSITALQERVAAEVAGALAAAL